MSMRHQTKSSRHPFVLGAALVVAAFAGTCDASTWTVTSLAIPGIPTGVYGGLGEQQVGDAGEGAVIWNGATGPRVYLMPVNAYRSHANAISGGKQVGYYEPDTLRACMWSGTAASVVDLHPAEAESSSAAAIAGNQQGGSAYFFVQPDPIQRSHAALWSGTAASFVDLNPTGSRASFVWGMEGSQQVGASFVLEAFKWHACTWNGTAASWVDLSPPGAGDSAANAVGDGQQVGSARFGDIPSACLWNGTAASFVNLNPAGSTQSDALGVCHGEQVGYVRINGQFHGALWSGTPESYVNLDTFLPPTHDFFYPRTIWSDAGHTYIGGAARNTATLRYEAMMYVRVNTPPPCTGDFNADGVVNTADLVVLLGVFGQTVPPGSPGDTNNDGAVNTIDLTAMLGAFGQACP